MRSSRDRLERVVGLALEERETLRTAGKGSLAAYLTSQGHEVVTKTLRAAVGGLEACVFPRPSGGFRFVCDPAASPRDPAHLCGAKGDRRRWEFRLAHEYAHTRLNLVCTREGTAIDPVELRCDVYAYVLLSQSETERRSTRERPELRKGHPHRALADEAVAALNAV